MIDLLYSLPLSTSEQYFAHMIIGALFLFVFWRRPFLALAGSFVLGLLKECLDLYSYGGFDVLDLFFTFSFPFFYLLTQFVTKQSFEI